jgi:hypothetical protein
MTMHTFVKRFLPAAAVAAVASMLPSASQAAPAAPAVELPSVLVIAKSSNRNEVHYAAVLTQDCEPVGDAPLHAYWRMLERGPQATEPLQDGEQRWLGLEHQDVEGDVIRMSLRALPGRTFSVHAERAGEGRCASWVGTTIAGVPARVASIFVKQKLFGVDYVLLSGWTEDGAQVTERLTL